MTPSHLRLQGTKKTQERNRRQSNKYLLVTSHEIKLLTQNKDQSDSTEMRNQNQYANTKVAMYLHIHPINKHSTSSTRCMKIIQNKNKLFCTDHRKEEYNLSTESNIINTSIHPNVGKHIHIRHRIFRSSPILGILVSQPDQEKRNNREDSLINIFLDQKMKF